MTDEKPFVRREIKPGEDFKISLIDNRRNWRVYNIPLDLINRYISYAKLRYDNEVWRVLEYGMQLIDERETIAKSLEQRIIQLEADVTAIKMLLNKEEEENKIPITFGEGARNG